MLRLPSDVPDPGLLPAPALRAAVPRGRPGGQQAVDGAGVVVPDHLLHVCIDTCCSDLLGAGTGVALPEFCPVIVTRLPTVEGGGEHGADPGLGAPATRLAALA